MIAASEEAVFECFARPSVTAELVCEVIGDVRNRRSFARAPQTTEVILRDGIGVKPAS